MAPTTAIASVSLLFIHDTLLCISSCFLRLSDFLSLPEIRILEVLKAIVSASHTIYLYYNSEGYPPGEQLAEP